MAIDLEGGVRRLGTVLAVTGVAAIGAAAIVQADAAELDYRTLMGFRCVFTGFGEVTMVVFSLDGGSVAYVNNEKPVPLHDAGGAGTGLPGHVYTFVLAGKLVAVNPNSSFERRGVGRATVWPNAEGHRSDGAVPKVYSGRCRPSKY